MKKKLLTVAFAVMGATMAGCDDISSDGIDVNRQVESAFRSRYPRTSRVEWEFKQGYYVADFRRNNSEAEAWFTPQGEWSMTETDVRHANLPQTVNDALEQTEYADWRIDDIDMLEYPDRETVYVIEVRQDHAEYTLYFTTDGVLVKVTFFGANPIHGNNDHGFPTPVPTPGPGASHHPSGVPSVIRAFITEKYPQARIVDIENEYGRIGVDIVDGRTPREVIFSSEGEWTRTETEVWYTNVPETVLNAMKASQFGEWDVDEINHYLTPTSEYYMFELESGPREVTLKIDATGNII